MLLSRSAKNLTKKIKIKLNSKNGKQIKSMDRDLLLIILGATICCAYYCFKDYKRNKEIKKQERLNQIK